MTQEGTGDEGNSAPDAHYAQMAEGLFHRFRTLSLSLDRRESFVWQHDEMEAIRDRTANESRRDEE